jgi:hypothetical protein
MAYEIKDNTGSVFTNDKKQKDTHPDRTGQAMIGGKAYWISGWVKQDRNGKPYMSLAFKLKDGQTAAPQKTYADERPAPARRNPAAANPRPNDDDDLIPFMAEFR